MKNFDIVVYHSPCSDGIVSVWSALRYNTNITMLPCNAGNISSLNFKLFDKKKVLFVDICPTYDEIIEISGRAKWITILDHHKTTFDMCVLKYGIVKNRYVFISNNIEYDIDMDRAGCQITWDYFFPHISQKNNRPWFHNYVADRDLWQWKLKSSREINAALFELNYLTIDKMNEMVNWGKADIDKLIDIGVEIMRKNEERLDKLCHSKTQCITTIGNVKYNIWLTDCDYKYRSEVGNKLSNVPFPNTMLPDFVAIWCLDPKSTDIWISLRNINEIDLNKVCKQYDNMGGGHFHAAGFTIRGQKLEDVFIPYK